MGTPERILAQLAVRHLNRRWLYDTLKARGNLIGWRRLYSTLRNDGEFRPFNHDEIRNIASAIGCTIGCLYPPRKKRKDPWEENAKELGLV